MTPGNLKVAIGALTQNELLLHKKVVNLHLLYRER
jgi:hypothetical protein